MEHKKNEKLSPAEISVRNEFRRSVQTINEAFEGKNGPAASDLYGAMLRRRKAATLSFMEKAVSRFAAKYPDLDISEEWIRLCATPCCSVNGLDDMCHISFAAGIWMLDSLYDYASPVEMDNLFPGEDNSAQCELEFFEPRYDSALINSAYSMICYRDGKAKEKAGLINEKAAHRTSPDKWQRPDGKTALSTARDRINAALAIIPSELMERAAACLEEKLWEYTDRYFASITEYAKQKKELRSSLARLDEEYQSIFRSFAGPNADPILQKLQSNQPLDPCTDLPFSLSAESMKEMYQAALKECDRFEDMDKAAAALEDKVKQIYDDCFGVRVYAPLLPIFQGCNSQDWEDHLLPETRQHFEGFSVDDPYEICFGFLYLIETGSDLPWLYAPALAVLSAAAAKLPWSVSAPVLPDLYTLEFCDSDPAVAGYINNPELRSKKAELYTLKYSPNIDPDECQSYSSNINLPQLIFGLSGMIMPRGVPETTGVLEALKKAGISEAEALVLEQYLRLANELHLSGSVYGKTALEKAEQRAAEIAGLNAPLPIEKMALELRSLKKQLAQAKDAQHCAEKALLDEQARLKQVMEQGAQERQELTDLRELVFCQCAGSEPEQEDTKMEQFPYQVTRRTFIIGGRDNWQNSIRSLLQGVDLFKVDANITSGMARRADVIWFQTNYISHAYYNKVIDIARNAGASIRYFTYSSAAKCAEQLAAADRKASSAKRGV